MDYFVSIEDTKYHKWQIELLAESLKAHDLDKNLIVAVAKKDGVSLNLPNSKLTYHDNIGKKLKCLPINKPYGLIKAIKENVIKFPFVIIDPDMVMISPVEESDSISAQYVWYMEYDQLVKYGFNIKDWLGISKEDWLPIGCIYQFPETPVSLFEEIYAYCDHIVSKKKTFTPTKAYWLLEMVAFVAAMIESDIEIKHNYEIPLDGRLKGEKAEINTNFIHYCNGIIGHFDKRNYGFKGIQAEVFPLLADPYHKILTIPHDYQRLNFMKSVVRRVKKQALHSKLQWL